MLGNELSENLKERRVRKELSRVRRLFDTDDETDAFPVLLQLLIQGVKMCNCLNMCVCLREIEILEKE